MQRCPKLSHEKLLQMFQYPPKTLTATSYIITQRCKCATRRHSENCALMCICMFKVQYGIQSNAAPALFCSPVCTLTFWRAGGRPRRTKGINIESFTDSCTRARCPSQIRQSRSLEIEPDKTSNKAAARVRCTHPHPHSIPHYNIGRPILLSKQRVAYFPW